VTPKAKSDYRSFSDGELATLISQHDPQAVQIVTTRNNQRLFRAAWSILKDRSDAEDAVQSAYLRAFAAIASFEGRSSLSTWLTRIAINEALGRRRTEKRRRARLDALSVADLDHYRNTLMNGSTTGASPESAVARDQLRRLLEEAIAGLPDAFRLVFVLRDVEGMSVEETSEALGVLPATVKTRLLRARRRLQQSLAPDVHSALSGSFPFAGGDCDAMTARVIAAFCVAR